MSQPASSRKPLVVGGKLKLKGSGSSARVKRTPVEQPSAPIESKDIPADTEHKQKDGSKGIEYLTASQRRHLVRKIEKEKEEAKKLSKISFRDRVEQFNNKLASMTEHNDIPRISAAGNG